MTMSGTLAFLGLAVLTMDVLGGVIATGILLRGGRLRHLLTFWAGYTAVIVVATLLLHPLLDVLGRWLHPILQSRGAVGAVEVVVGLALSGFAVHQARAARRPPLPRDGAVRRTSPARLAAWPLLAAGVAFSATALADPAFTIAVGMASQEQHLALRIALLMLWHLLYQAPLVTMTVIAGIGKHDRLVQRLAQWFAERRQPLQTALAVVLAVLGLAVLGDGAFSLFGEHVPWLSQLVALR